MYLHPRPMRPQDVRECVEMIAAHPVIGPQYGSAIDDLRLAWLHLLGRDAIQTRIVEQREGTRVSICFVGVSVCVHDRFVQELKNSPQLWFGPELARRVLGKDSPVLSDQEVREANSSGGLNLLVWSGYCRRDLENQSALYLEAMSAFIEAHRGYLWKEVICSPIESVERLQFTINSGGMLWNTKEGRYVDSLERDPADIIREPHVVGITREIDLERRGSWVGLLFKYHPPQFGFTRSEQRLLLAALESNTDEELSQVLHVSLPTVKKTWLSIYERATARLPQLLPTTFSANGDNLQRGREKRRLLLAYLRNFPEELRPVSRRLLS
jgi:DNA-binding CsgD family transcriptional regulator